MPCVSALSYGSHCNELTLISSDIDSNILRLYNISYVNVCCNSTDCISQPGYCVSSQFVADALSVNSYSYTLPSLIISDSCNPSSSSTPFVTVTLVVSLKVNLVYISAYNNLTSNESLTLIANFKSFVRNCYSF